MRKRKGIITVRFTTRWPPNPLSLVIAFASGSRTWSHTMNIIDGTAYEATMQHGCRTVPVDIAMRGVAKYRDMHVEVPDIEAARKWGEKQKGGFDFAGAFGIPFLMSEDWSDDSKWWCSEYSFAQIGAGGLWLLDPEEKKRVTPDDLHQCNYLKTSIVRL